jgi:hypothetical protein
MQKNILNRLRGILLLSGILAFCSFQEKSNIYICKNGMVGFISEAPLELIKASSKNLTGVLNIKERTFSFQIPIVSFQGFNSSLQRIHFNEDYLESDIYPSSTFKGKLIEEVDLSVPGVYKIRAKGKMSIHGVEIDRIVRCDLNVRENNIEVKAAFTVFLADHNISIPSIVNQKIAEEIKVDLNLTLTPSDK